MLSWLRSLVVPTVPESVQPRALLRVVRTAIAIDLLVAALNAGCRFLLGERGDVAAYDTFLAWNLPAHALVITMLLAILRSSGELRDVGGRMRIALAAAAWTAVAANWLIGGFTATLNLAFATVLICSARLLLGWRLGLFTLIAVVVADTAGALLRIGGAFPERSPIPDYVLEDTQIAFVAVGLRAVVTTATFVLTSYVVNRFRAAEHALQRRDVELSPVAVSPEALAATMTAPAGTDEYTLPARQRATGHLTSPAPFHIEVGVRLDRYELTDHLGAGAMGVVFEARDTELDRKVAVKIVSPRTGDAGTARSRLRREAQAMARLSHPNVATVFDIGTVGDQLFIAMELVRGTTLRSLVGSERPWRETLPILLAAARGLAAAHDAGVVHRDFKPDNVLLRDDGAVRVSDFGLAREAADRPDRPRAADSGDAALDALVTATGAIVGTPAYLAPESAQGIADAATDQFAFAVTAFEVLDGQRPFESVHIVELLRGERTDLPMRPWRRRDVPAAVRAVIERALAVDPAARWPSMAELVARLEGLGKRSAYVRSAVGVNVAISAAAAIAMVALAVGVVLVTGGDSRRRDAIDEQAAILANPGASANVRAAAADELARSTDARAIAVLTEALRDDGDLERRGIAARALAPYVTEAAGAGAALPATGDLRPWAAGVSDGEQAEALRLFHTANQLHADEKFEESVRLYRQALGHWSHPAIHYNLALALLNVDQPVEMREALEAAMRYGGAPLSQNYLERARAFIVLLDRELGRVEYTVGDATLLLDGKDVFIGPGTFRRRVVAGPHDLATRANGQLGPTHRVTVRAGETSVLSL